MSRTQQAGQLGGLTNQTSLSVSVWLHENTHISHTHTMHTQLFFTLLDIIVLELFPELEQDLPTETSSNGTI